MSQIDIQNAKQIRDPMTVLISMEVPEDVAVTYSDFQNVKIEDAQLGQRAWPMRQLADMQGEGFALDGSRSLYDPSVTASAANGKIGIRGDVGEDVTFTVSGDSDINGLSLAATGTDRVLFNGQTATFSDGQVIIPVGSDNITLTFPAEETDRRVEVSFTLPGTSLKVTNDSIISCIVSLRSDLSIEDPTLPESEMNVDIYNDVDISEAVASIPDDTPITYSAGYPGDMSPERKFYISGQITWSDNVLSIHAVDAVHFLDTTFDPMLLWADGYTVYKTCPDEITGALSFLLEKNGFSFNPEGFGFYIHKGAQSYYDNIVMQRTTVRDLIAYIQNVLHIDNIPNDASSSHTTSYWPIYVDAGRPSFDTVKPSVSFSIDQEDCGDVKKGVSPMKKIVLNHKSPQMVTSMGKNSFGNFEWYKNKGAFIDISELVVELSYQIFRDPDRGLRYNTPVLPATTQKNDHAYGAIIYGKLSQGGSQISRRTGRYLLDSESKSNVPASDGGTFYTQIIDWGVKTKDGRIYQKVTWDYLAKCGYVSSTDTELTGYVAGASIMFTEEELSYGEGLSTEIEETINGHCDIADSSGTMLGEIYPTMAMESLLSRSNITGSFTWKGDPRMQPRDVVEFHRLDGTVEEITLENITLHHEGGGTYAEITYRKGVC